MLDNVASCYAGLRINAVLVQLFGADYKGLLYERPSAAVGIFKLAFDDTWLGIVANVPNYGERYLNRILPARVGSGKLLA